MGNEVCPAMVFLGCTSILANSFVDVAVDIVAHRQVGRQAEMDVHRTSTFFLPNALCRLAEPRISDHKSSPFTPSATPLTLAPSVPFVPTLPGWRFSWDLLWTSRCAEGPAIELLLDIVFG